MVRGLGLGILALCLPFKVTSKLRMTFCKEQPSLGHEAPSVFPNPGALMTTVGPTGSIKSLFARNLFPFVSYAHLLYPFCSSTVSAKGHVSFQLSC